MTAWTRMAMALVAMLPSSTTRVRAGSWNRSPGDSTTNRTTATMIGPQSVLGPTPFIISPCSAARLHCTSSAENSFYNLGSSVHHSVSSIQCCKYIPKRSEARTMRKHAGEAYVARLLSDRCPLRRWEASRQGKEGMHALLVAEARSKASCCVLSPLLSEEGSRERFALLAPKGG
jgi:hypothetical protein